MRIIRNKFFVLVAVIVGLFGAKLVSAQEVTPTDVNIPRLAHESRAELLSLGCEQIDLINKQALLAARSLDWRIVSPADALDQSIILCSSAVIDGLQPIREGQVEAAVNEAQAQTGVSDPGVGVGLSDDGSVSIPSIVSPREDEINPIAGTIVWLLNLLSNAGLYLLSVMLNYIPLLLAVRGFLSQSFVATGWQGAIGIANLGFMLALVFIALMVTLRLDDGGGARRLLPRFLLAALLVNFSLIIAVAIIDFSRLLMAIMLSFFGYGGPGALAAFFKAQIGVAEIVKQVGDFFSALTNEWSDIAGAGRVVAAILLVLIVFSLAGAALVVFVGLLIRYIMLIVLLVLSPFAYLFVALPNTTNLAKLWWKNFLKYVFYAPAVLLVLIATAEIAGHDEFWQSIVSYIPMPTRPDDAAVYSMMVQLAEKAAIAVGLMLAAGSGRWAGIVGSAAVMGAVSKAGARGKAMYLGGLRRGGRAAGRTAYVGTGARDFVGVARKGIRENAKAVPWLKPFVPAKRDASGKLLKGQQSFGKTFGEFVTGRPSFDPKASNRQLRRREMRAAPATEAAVGTHSAYKPGNLALQEVGEVMKEDQINVVIKHAVANGNMERLLEMARNPSAVDKMNPEQKVEIANMDVDDPTPGNVGFYINAQPPTQQDKIRDTLRRQIRDVKTALRRSVEETDSERW